MRSARDVVALVFLVACGGGGDTPSPEDAGPIDAPVDTPPPVNQPPALAVIGNVSVVAGATQMVTLSATDPDGDTLTYSTTGMPAFGQLSGNTITFSPPANEAPSSTQMTATVSDGTLSDARMFTVSVTQAVNQAPTLSMLAQVDANGTAVATGASDVSPPRLRATIDDPDNDQVKLEVEVAVANTPFTNTATASTSLGAEGVITAIHSSLAGGTYKWQARAVDASNQASAWTQFAPGSPAFVIDPGDVSGTLAIAANAVAVNTTTVTLTLAATSTNGAVTQMRFSNDGVTYSAYEAYATTKANYALASGGDGTKSVYVEYRDANNVTYVASDTILLDTVAPSLTNVTLAGGAADTNQQTVSLTYTASDVGAGLETPMAANDAATYIGIGASPTTWMLSAGEGVKTVTVRARDLAGNATTLADTITLDVTAPTGSVSINSAAMFTNNPMVTLTLTPFSPAVAYCAKETNSAPANAQDACFKPLASTGYMLSSGDAAKTVYVWFADAANNVSAAAAQDSITLDTTPPTLIVSTPGLGLAGGLPYTTSLVVDFGHGAGDTNSLQTICTGTVSPPTNCQPPFLMPTVTLAAGDGVKTAYIQVFDPAGNGSVILSDTITLDQTPPTLTMLPINSGAVMTNSATVSVTTTADDATSGLATIHFGLDGTTFPTSAPYAATVMYAIPGGDGAKQVYARVRDAAGNYSTSPYLTQNITVDTTPPTLSITAAGGNDYTSTSPTSVAINAIEGGTGITKMCIKVTAVGMSASTPAANDACFVNYATPASAALHTSGPGNKRLWVWLLDAAGNISAVANDDVWFDPTAPTAPPFVVAAGAHRKLSLSWDPSTDASSGIDRYEIGTALVSGGPYVYTSYVPEQPGFPNTYVTAPNTVMTYVVVRAVDKAGNYGATSTEVSAAARYPFAPQLRTPTSADLSDLAYSPTADRVFAVGAGGALYQTTGTIGGASAFTRRDPMTDADLYDVHVDSGNSVWVAGSGGYIARSTNHGTTFTPITNTDPLKSHLYGFTYAGASSGPLPSSYWVGVGYGGAIVRGASSALAPLSSFSPVTSPTTKMLYSVAHCANGLTVCQSSGIVVAVGAEGTIIRSTDRGQTWNIVAPPAGYAVAATELREVTHQPNSDIMMITGTVPAGLAGVLISTDGGATWAPMTSPSTTDVQGSAITIDSVGGVWVSGTIGGTVGMLRIFSGSRTLQTLPSFASFTGAARALVATDTSHALGAGDFGGLMGTSTGGPTWFSLVFGSHFHIYDFGGPLDFLNTAWVVGTGGSIYRTTTSGASWFQQGSGVTTATLTGVASFVDDGTIAGTQLTAVGHNGTILSSSNGGTNWFIDGDSGITTQHLYDVACNPGLLCYAVGANQTVLAMAGADWSVQTSGAGSASYMAVDSYRDAAFKVRAIAVGTSGVTRRLDDTTWSNGSIPGANLRGVYAKRDLSIEESSGIVIAVGNDEVYRSTNHGANWTLVESLGLGVALLDVMNVPGTMTWYTTGADGATFKSTNDGVDWTPVASGTSNMLNAIHVTEADPEKVWLGGFGGTIRYSTTGAD